jgi:hypothetical protein
MIEAAIFFTATLSASIEVETRSHAPLGIVWQTTEIF